MSLATIIQGDTYGISLEFTDETTDVPIDISGRTLVFTVKRHFSEPDEVAQFKQTQELPTDLNTQSGKAFIVVDAEETFVLMPGDYVYDIKLSTDGIVSSLLNDRIKVIAGITRTM